MPGITTAFAQGLAASRPAAAASNAGFMWLSTDTNGGTLYQSTGSAWVQLAAAVSAPATAPSFSWVTKTSAYTLATTDTGILADASGAAFTLTLPTAVGSTARYSIKKKDSSANAVTIATTSAQTIDGASTLALSSPGSTLDLISDGSNWYGAGGPRGQLGYAVASASQSSSSTTLADMTGLSLTVTVGARPLRISVYAENCNASGSTTRMNMIIYDVTGAAQVAQSLFLCAPNATGICQARVAPAPGSRTYKAQFATNDVGTTVNYQTGATNPSFILVEEL